MHSVLSSFCANDIGLKRRVLENVLDAGVTYVDGVWSFGLKESWEGLLVLTDVSTSRAEVIFRVKWQLEIQEWNFSRYQWSFSGFLSPRQWNSIEVQCLLTSNNRDDFCIDLQICGGRIAQSAVCPLAWWRRSAFSGCTLLSCLESSPKVQVCVLWSSHQLIWYQFFIFSKP